MQIDKLRVNMRHDVVSQLLFARGHVRPVDVAQVGLQLVDLVGRDRGDAEAHLGLQQPDPQLAPRDHLVLVGPQVQHLAARVVVGKGRLVQLLVGHLLVGHVVGRMENLEQQSKVSRK